MKKILMVIGLSILPMLSFATFQTSTPTRGATPSQKDGNLGYAAQYSNQITAQTFKGSLKDNVTRIAKNNGWKLVWNVKQPLSVLLQTKLSGPNFVEVMNQLLNHYPIEASYQYDFQSQGQTLIVDEAPAKAVKKS